MKTLPTVPAFSPAWGGYAVVLETAPGPTRDLILEQWLDEARQAGATTWLLHCSFEEVGLWAGLAQLLEDLFPRIQARAPHLIERHSYELCLIAPRLREHVVVRNPNLTETVSDDEKVRNYPADRAYRSLHGVIDLLAEWRRIAGDGPWVIAADDFDRADDLVNRFFAELLRRRGREIGLTLLLAVSPGNVDATIRRIQPERRGLTVRLDGDAAPPPSPIARVAWARDIEREIARSPRSREALLPVLIHAREEAGTEAVEILRLKVEAMYLYNHRGLYQAAAVYAPAVEAALSDLHATDPKLHDLAVNALFFTYVPLGRSEPAYRVVKHEMRDRADDPTYLPRICYMLAMLHARFLPTHDLGQAEDYLNRGLEVLRTLPSDALTPDRRAFLTVFLENGLALVRVRQRRPQEAVRLCREGVARLDHELHPDQHRLHRSVLVYNIAQVYAQTGPYEEALDQFAAVMALDPNYSEYYNERGAVLLKMGRLEEAASDFRQAIELSPPYAEVWTNLGQCYREMGRMEDAVQAYSRALDLDPTVPLAVIGRADAYASLGDHAAALTDYANALTIVPNEAALYASRAVVHYELGALQPALADLDTAISLAPKEADYYQNRAVALADLGRADEAAADLHTYLQLAPDAKDRDVVAARLEELQGGAVLA